MALTPVSPQRGRPKPQLIDEWSIREKLALASSVCKSGDQNWHSTSRQLRGFTEPNRPADWFSQKNCALQYEDMLEKVEQPKRKRGERGEETAQDVIVRELTLQRIAQCKQLIAESTQKLNILREERKLVMSENPPEELLKKIWQRKLDEDEAEKAAEVRHAKFLKEREAKIESAKRVTRQNLVRSNRTPLPQTPAPSPTVAVKIEDHNVIQTRSTATDNLDVTAVADSSSSVPCPQNPPLTSPLLTSLLQSSSGPAAPYKDSKETSSPSKSMSGSVFFSNQLSPARQQQISALTSPARVSGDEGQQPSASPTLSKLLEMPLSSASATKLPPLPGFERDSQSVSAENSSETSGQVAVARDNTLEAVVKSERKDDGDNADDSKSEAKNDEEVRTPLTRRTQRELRTRTAAVAPSTPVPLSSTTSSTSAHVTPAAVVSTSNAAVSGSAPSSSVATRRSGRIRGIRESESESSSLPDKKPTLDDLNLIDASASEESLDAISRTAVSSKAPSVSDSIPDSPASTMHSEDTDLEKDRKRWQRAILSLCKQASTHQYGYIFLHPAEKEVGDTYTEAIKRPLDLTSIKRRVENQAAENAIRTTAEFQRDIMLMFQNALMYNKKGHDVFEIALEMQKEIGDAIEEFAASEKQSVTTPAANVTSSTGGKSSSGSETPANASKQRIRRPAGATSTPSTVSTPSQAQEEASSRRRSRTSTDTDPGTSASVPLTRTALKKKATG